MITERLSCVASASAFTAIALAAWIVGRWLIGLVVRPYCHNDNYWQVFFDTNRVIAETMQANITWFSPAAPMLEMRSCGSWCAFFSISSEMSIPVMLQFFGYSGRFKPVPTPTSRIRSPGLIPAPAAGERAASRPLARQGRPHRHGQQAKTNNASRG